MIAPRTVTDSNTQCTNIYQQPLDETVYWWVPFDELGHTVDGQCRGPPRCSKASFCSHDAFHYGIIVQYPYVNMVHVHL
jgi:hypothetical protein